MCRLTAVTFTNKDKDAKRQIFLQMMRIANGERQEDGWGVTDGSSIWKAGDTFVKSDLSWYNNLDTSGIVVGHVRAASQGTFKTDLEAHPFIFKNDDGSTRFIAAHNGFIDDTYRLYDGVQVNVPVSDSYRAFYKLSQMVGEDSIIDRSVLEEWINIYGSTSAYAFMILDRFNDLHIFRNDQRTLYCASVGNGWIINTSYDVVKATSNYIKNVYMDDVSGIMNIKPSIYCRIKAGDPDLIGEDINLPKYEAKKNYFHKPVTNPVSSGLVPVNNSPPKMKDSNIEYQNKEFIVDNICQQYKPLRPGIVRLLIAYTMGKKNDMGYTLNLDEYTIEELTSASICLKDPALTDDIIKSIEEWNQSVTEIREVDLHMSLVPDGEMFYDPPNADYVITYITQFGEY